MLMKLYDDLCVGIPSGIRVEGCAVGKYWTTVRANGNIGIAPTLGEVENAAEFAAGFLGKFLRDVGNHMHWDSLPAASVGVAALCAYYNTAARAEGLGGVSETPCAPAEQDVKRVSAEALITRELPAILEAAGEGGVVISGVGVPCSASFFAFDMPVRAVEGYYPRFPETVEAAALRDIADPAPGLLPFRVTPRERSYLHERENTRRYLGSPYKAAGFNQRFNPWEGKDYDRAAWSPLYRG